MNSSAIAIFRAGSVSFIRSEEHTSELQSQSNLVCRLLLEKKKKDIAAATNIIVIMSDRYWIADCHHTLICIITARSTSNTYIIETLMMFNRSLKSFLVFIS